MNLIKALTLSLGESDRPVLTLYDIGILLHRLYASKKWGDTKISHLQKECATSAELSRAVNKLEATGVLLPFPGLNRSAFTLLGRKDVDPEEVLCSMDPFCYLSHLTAMGFHGLTDRLPTTIFASSPKSTDWKQYAAERMRRDLGNDFDAYIENGMPPLKLIKIEKIKRREVHTIASTHLGAYTNVRGRTLRVSSIGRTFLDMLRKPEHCGGIRHVLEVFEKQGEQYFPLIVNELDQNGGPIDKVRAGYILQERMGLLNPAISKWTAYAQRGGSRKLDASSEYAPEWSDTWCLSINV